MLETSKYSEHTDRAGRWYSGRKYRKRKRYGRCARVRKKESRLK